MTVMKKSNKEDAVSPVIGVMLMLVVTIVIAAVVAAFASGLGTDMESTPTAVFDVEIGATSNNVKVQHLSGENLLISKMSVKVQYGDKSGDATFSEQGFFTPGMTLSSTTLPTELGIGSAKGKYVTVLIIYDGKHVIFNKDLIVQ